MKTNEILFFALVCLTHNNNGVPGCLCVSTAYMMMVRMGYSEKQLLYYIKKWEEKYDFVDVGVSEWCGWVRDENELPPRYKFIHDHCLEIVERYFVQWLSEYRRQGDTNNITLSGTSPMDCVDLCELRKL